MKLRALRVGVWCGSLQLSLIYGLSFLWSSTAYTALWVLVAWIGGSLLGLQPERRFRSSVWLYPLLPPLTLVFIPGLPPQVLLFSSLIGGLTAGNWLLGLEQVLIQAWRWESLGMGVGYLMTGLIAYHGLDAIAVWFALLTGVLVWRESRSGEVPT